MFIDPVGQLKAAEKGVVLCDVGGIRDHRVENCHTYLEMLQAQSVTQNCSVKNTRVRCCLFSVYRSAVRSPIHIAFGKELQSKQGISLLLNVYSYLLSETCTNALGNAGHGRPNTSYPKLKADLKEISPQISSSSRCISRLLQIALMYIPLQP